MNEFDSNRGSAGGPWQSWGPPRIVALAFVLLAGNFVWQIAIYATGGGLYATVLAGAVPGVFLPLLWLVRAGKLSLADLSLDRPRPLTLLASAGVAAATIVPVSVLAEFSLRLHPVDPDWVRLFREGLPDSPLEYALAFAAVVVAAPLAEEIIFRGLLHRLASRLWGGPAAAATSSLVFAIVHAEPWVLLGLVGVGLMLALVYERTRSVTACWVAHGVHNGISMGVMLASGEIVTEPGPIGVAQWGWAGVSLLAVVLLARWLKPAATSRKPEDPDRY